MPPKPKDARDPWTRNRAASYLSLPPMPPPETTRPVTFCIPDHPDWRAALYGSIALMGSWLAWKRDEAHTGKDVAEVWRGIIQSAALAAERGEPSECMDWCQIIADCIANNPATQQAIANLIATNQDVRDTIIDVIRDAANQGKLPIETRTSNLLGQLECTKGSMFKRISTLVTTLHFLSLDIFQLIRQATVPAERAEKVISAIPVIGILPIDEVIGLATAIVNSVSLSYEAAYNDIKYDKIRCDLLCEFEGQCGFSLEEVTGWYLDRAGSIPELQDPLELVRTVLTFIATGNPGNDIAIYAMHLLALAIIRSGEAIMGTDFSRLALRIEADADEVDDDWEQLCLDCNDVVVDPECFDLTADRHGWTEQAGGTWLSGVGFRAAYNQFSNQTVLRVFYEGVAFPRHVNKVVMTFSVPKTDIALYYANFGNYFMYSGPAQTVVEFSAATIPGWTNYNTAFGLALNTEFTGNITNLELPQICIYMVEP